MTKPSWHKVALARVPAKPTGFWTPVGDYIIGPRLLRFQIVAADDAKQQVRTVWNLDAATECSADGVIDTPPKGGLLLPVAPRGSLIAKIGGGSTDLPELPAGALPTSPVGAVYPGRRAFAVGSFCVVRITVDESGQLFLTANDSPADVAAHTGELHVLIEEASI